jgi:CheY-like chemotaxis protein
MNAQHRRTVLAVGDAPETLAALASALDSAGYRALTADTGAAATLLSAFRFALIVADAGPAFGDGDGAEAHRETLDRLRGLAGDIPLLVVPAHDPVGMGALISTVATAKTEEVGGCNPRRA